MNTIEAAQRVKQELVGIYENGEAGNIADLVIEHITGISKAQKILQEETLLSTYQTEKLETIIKRLKNNEPVQYVIGKTWFYGLEIFVDSSVLIPRPETEELVDWIVKDVKLSHPHFFDKTLAAADRTDVLKVLDVGTGSGCIALALKKNIPKAEVWGCDTSDEALNVARRNGSALDIRVDFQGVDFLDIAQQRSLPSVDLVVSNPPYVLQSDRNSMRPNVVDHEPHLALFVPDEDALVFYKALISFCEHRLHPQGKIYMEIHENYGAEVSTMFEANGFEVDLKKDMQGKERMVRAIKK